MDIDVSYFENVNNEDSPIPSCHEDRFTAFDDFSEAAPSSLAYDSNWDLSTPYLASFRAKYRVTSKITFQGYDSFYVQMDVKCPEGSEWKTALLYKDSYLASSPWFPSTKETYTTKYYNLDTSRKYRVAFVKTDNEDYATGTVTVYK